MDMILVGDHSLLEALHTDMSLSPEDFLCAIEDALESGEITLDDARALINNYNAR